MRQQVTEMPQIDATNFPQLPEWPHSGPAWVQVMASPLGNREKEFVLGIIVSHSIRQGGWQPISGFDFNKMLNHRDCRMIGGQPIINAMWAMAESSLIKVLEFEGVDYLVPSRELAAMINKSRLYRG